MSKDFSGGLATLAVARLWEERKEVSLRLLVMPR